MCVYVAFLFTRLGKSIICVHPFVRFSLGGKSLETCSRALLGLGILPLALRERQYNERRGAPIRKSSFSTEFSQWAIIHYEVMLSSDEG